MNKILRFHGLRMTRESARVWSETQTAMMPLEPRNDVRNHSPDGFEWGYGGSGPAQLALAIALALLEDNRADALRVYQDVKWHFVAKLTGGAWTLEAAPVVAFISAQLNAYRERDILEGEREELRQERELEGPNDDARVRQAEGDAYGVDNEPS